MKLFKKATAIVTSLALACTLCATPAFAANNEAAAVKKDESVFILLRNDGSVQKQIVSDWLHSDSGFADVRDESNLTGIENLKSDVVPEQDGSVLRWTTDDTDIYYQGTSTETPPLTVAITYTLDGKTVVERDLEGKSGHVSINIELTNNEKGTATIGGKERTIYTPFFTVIAADLPVGTFSNVAAQHGTVQTDASNQLVAFVAAPGMRESFQGMLSSDLSALDDYLTDTVTIETDVENYSMPSLMIMASTNVQELQSDIVLPDISGQLSRLGSATQQLQDGAKTLASATDTLNTKMSEFQSSYATFDAGVDSAMAGSKEVQSGTQGLLTGAQSLATGTQTLAAGAQGLATGSSTLQSTLTNQMVPGLTAAAAQQATLTAEMQAVQQTLATVTIPDVPTLKAQLGTGVDQVFDAAASGAATAAADAAKTYSTQAADAAAAAAISAALASSGLSSTDIDAVVAAAQGAIDGAIATNVDSSAISAAVVSGMAGNKATAVATVTSALDSIDTAPLTAAMGQFQTLSTDASSLLTSMGTLTGSLYNAADPADATTVYGAVSALSAGAAQVSDGAAQASAGAAQLSGGAAQLNTGASSLAEGLSKLSASSKTVKDAIGQFKTGSASLAEGTTTLQNGIDTYADQAISKLLSSTSDLEDVEATVNALRERAEAYGNYSGSDDSMECSVKFVMKTTADETVTSDTEADAAAAEAAAQEADEKVDAVQDNLWNRIKNLFH